MSMNMDMEEKKGKLGVTVLVIAIVLLLIIIGILVFRKPGAVPTDQVPFGVGQQQMQNQADQQATNVQPLDLTDEQREELKGKIDELGARLEGLEDEEEKKKIVEEFEQELKKYQQ